MKALLHYFSRDTAQAMETETSFDIADIEKAIRDEIYNQDPDTALMLEFVTFGSDMWLKQWSLWNEKMSEKQHYYNYGSNEIELPERKPEGERTVADEIAEYQAMGPSTKKLIAKLIDLLMEAGIKFEL